MKPAAEVGIRDFPGLAGGGTIQATQLVEEGALPRSGRAHNGDVIARRHVEVDTIQGSYFLLSDTVAATKLTDTQGELLLGHWGKSSGHESRVS